MEREHLDQQCRLTLEGDEGANRAESIENIRSPAISPELSTCSTQQGRKTDPADPDR